jgi:hypothetical protein
MCETTPQAYQNNKDKKEEKENNTSILFIQFGSK